MMKRDNAMLKEWCSDVEEGVKRVSGVARMKADVSVGIYEFIN